MQLGGLDREGTFVSTVTVEGLRLNGEGSAHTLMLFHQRWPPIMSLAFQSSSAKRDPGTLLGSFFRSVHSLIPVAAYLASTGCSLALKTDGDQCLEDADCAARGPGFTGTVCLDKVCQTPPDTTWACVGHVAPPVAGPDYVATIMLVDAISQSPVTDATVLLCSKLDPPCASPLQTVTVAADGTASASVAPTFNGYFSIQSTKYLPTLYFIDTGGTAAPSNVSLISPAAQAGLNQTLGITADPDNGSVNISLSDCNHQKAAGAQFAIDPAGASLPYYSIASVISRTATETDASGNGGFINAQPGSSTLTVSLAKTGETVGQVTTLVRAGTLTFQPMRPTPLP